MVGLRDDSRRTRTLGFRLIEGAMGMRCWWILGTCLAASFTDANGIVSVGRAQHARADACNPGF
ncbi:MAG: hypothetical protein AAGF92_16545 [Myxococcota bacterium]